MKPAPSRCAGSLLVVAALAASCTFGTPGPPTAAPTPTSKARPSARPVPTGRGSAAAAMKALCVPPSGGGGGPAKSRPTPPQLATVEGELQKVRGLKFKHPVPVDPITQARMDAKISTSFAPQYPLGFWARRSRAWQTMGVIPPGASLRAAYLKFQTGQVVGFYNPSTGELVYIGTPTLNTEQKFTLAHELTHALDDQHFNLRRTDHLVAHCRDEDYAAALGAIEGNAQYFATQVMLQYPDNLSGGGGGGGSLAGVPPFLTALEVWPYVAGQAFITALFQRGGLKEVNSAIKHLPTSAEQVMHPALYPSDKPQPVDIPDLGPRLGSHWTDLDVRQVGEEFLKAMLSLRLDSGVAGDAAAGWGGGLYRAWSHGASTAVVLKTTWDTNADATQFLTAMKQWLAKQTGGPAVVLRTDPWTVQVGFTSDSATLAALKKAVG